MKNDNFVFLIGLTGGSGSGKTLISDVFSSRGIPAIDADKLAREIVEPGKPALSELVRAFGEEILLPDGSLDRRALAKTAFSDAEKLALLNKVTHKYIGLLMNENIEKYKANGAKYVLFDAPVLIEGGFHKKCDAVVCVLANRETRIKRIMARDELTLEEAERRLGAQHDDDFYISHSDYVIYNDGVKETAQQKTSEVIDKILNIGGANEETHTG